MTDVVDQTLRIWRTTPFDWGGSDCLLSVGAYMAACGSPDLTGDFRGTYSDEAGALAHVEAAGGATALIDRVGWPETAPAGMMRGDVAVADLGDYGVGGICTGQGFAMRLERGVLEVSLRALPFMKAWKCPL